MDFGFWILKTLQQQALSHVKWVNLDFGFWILDSENLATRSLEPRQMGKSSWRVRTMERLQNSDINCGAIDISAVGIQTVTLEQWYAAIAGFLAKRFHLILNVAKWWHAQAHLPLVSGLGEFLETVILVEIKQPIVIFIDEIDSILSLKFPSAPASTVVPIIQPTNA